ncbi:MAG: hypothetical protein AAGJ83_15905, partial [Planctomycetota bacterium]
MHRKLSVTSTDPTSFSRFAGALNAPVRFDCNGTNAEVRLLQDENVASWRDDLAAISMVRSVSSTGIGGPFDRSARVEVRYDDRSTEIELNWSVYAGERLEADTALVLLTSFEQLKFASVTLDEVIESLCHEDSPPRVVLAVDGWESACLEGFRLDPRDRITGRRGTHPLVGRSSH